MPHSKKIFIALLIPILIQCKKIEEEKAIQDLGQFPIKIIETICYPSDSIMVTFMVDSSQKTDGTMIVWQEPNTLTNFGPFQTKVKSNVTLKYQAIQGNQLANYEYVILKDTIDSLKYDFRNRFIGTFHCNVKNTYYTNDSPGVEQYRYFESELRVSKSSKFGYIIVDPFPFEQQIMLPHQMFQGYKTYGYFYLNGDSIKANYRPGVAAHWYDYNGRKVK